jgi:hypothetical protein
MEALERQTITVSPLADFVRRAARSDSRDLRLARDLGKLMDG